MDEVGIEIEANVRGEGGAEDDDDDDDEDEDDEEGEEKEEGKEGANDSTVDDEAHALERPPEASGSAGETENIAADGKSPSTATSDGLAVQTTTSLAQDSNGARGSASAEAAMAQARKLMRE